MADERIALCKICGKEYRYSLEWAKTLEMQGRQPTEYCPSCRTLHSRMRSSLAMPYYKARPTKPRRPDKDLKPGRLGRLSHVDRNHQTVQNIARFHLPDSDIDFGIKDPDIVDLFSVLDRHKVTVVVGPTGSGKSTYLPYRLMAPPPPIEPDHFTRYGQIIVTQPRIQAARTIPEFVARDLHGSSLGAGCDIGFIHRGEKAADGHSKLVYCTDGILINWISSGQIGNFSIIMIDEAHERSLNIDVILGLLKQRLPLYPNLKLIIASATIDSDLFINHFNQPGNPVGFKDFAGLKKFGYKKAYKQQKLSERPRPEDMANAVSQQSVKILQDIARARLTATPPDIGSNEPAPEGDILIFMPTVASIDKTANNLRQAISENSILNQREIEVHTLHRQLPMEQQNLALRKKYQAIGSKIMEKLIEIVKKQTADGDVLAYTLDQKSAQDCIRLLENQIESNSSLHGTAIGIDFSHLSIPKWTGKPHRTVIVTPYDLATLFKNRAFKYQIHDRRVIISTNVAETSLTVDGIVYVVDSGLILRKEWDIDTLTESFRPNWHSQDGCKQRWGRAGRVRDGFAYTMYTQEQFDKFDSHTRPEIQRAPLEAVVLTAKRAGVDDVAAFPWIQLPESKEIDRAIETLKERDLLDRDGDLTETGQMVSAINEEPNIGHLLVLADQLACVQEGATLAAMLQYKPRGGLLRWQNKWDGHTRRLVRKVHESLETGCEDDLAFYMKIFYSWSEAWRPEANWLTDDLFSSLWPARIPPIDHVLEASIGKQSARKIAAGVRQVRSIDDLHQLVGEHVEKPFIKTWLKSAENGFIDARRAAWAQRFFVNHDILRKIDEARREILAKLAIGKKIFEDRPLNFGPVMERLRFALMYSWPDRIYIFQEGQYQAANERIQKLEAGLTIEIGHDSLISRREESLPGFVCGRRAANSRGNIFISMLARCQPDWLPGLRQPLIEAARWFAVEWNNKHPKEKSNEGLFFDQNYPLYSRWACEISAADVPSLLDGKTINLLEPPPVINEMTPDGQIVYVENPGDGTEMDLIPDIRHSTAVHSFQENEESMEEVILEDDFALKLVPVRVINATDFDSLRVVVDSQELKAIGLQTASEFYALREGSHELIVTSLEDPKTILLETQISVDFGISYLILITRRFDQMICRTISCKTSSDLQMSAAIRFLHAAQGVEPLEISVSDQNATHAIPFLERTPYMRVPFGRLDIHVRISGQSNEIVQDCEVGKESITAFAVTNSNHRIALLIVRDQPELPINALPLLENKQRMDSSYMSSHLDQPPQTVQILPFPECKVGDVIPARVIGLVAAEGKICLQMKSDPIPGAFEDFCSRYAIGDSIVVKVVEIDWDEYDNYLCVIVQPVDLDIEIVLEAQDLTFAGRQVIINELQQGDHLTTIIQEISRNNRRIYLSLLPILEKYLPKPGSEVAGKVIERAQGGGLYLALETDTGELPVPIVAFLDGQNLPQALIEASVGALLWVKVAPPTRRERNLKSIPPTFTQFINEPEWSKHVGWDDARQKLWVENRITNRERQILRQKADVASVRWAIDNLYRLSNSLDVYLDLARVMDVFLSDHPVGSKVKARVIKIWKSELQVSVANTGLAKVPLADVKRCLLRRVDVGDQFDVIIEGFDKNTGYLKVHPITKADSLRSIFQVGNIYHGQVTRIERYGAFVKIGENNSGLVHASHLGYQQPRDITQYVREGEEVNVKVQNILDDGRIELSMQLDEYNPIEACRINSQMDGEVVHLLPIGALVRVGVGMVGMIHISELAWKRVDRPAEIVAPGQRIKVRVLGVHGNPAKIDLSLKSAFRLDFSIPVNQIRKVIGANGNTIRSIKAESGTNILIDPDGAVHVQGSTASNISKAQKSITALINL